MFVVGLSSAPYHNKAVILPATFFQLLCCMDAL